MKRYLALFCLLFVVALTGCSGKQTITATGTAALDAYKGRDISRAQAILLAKRAALIDAQRNLLEEYAGTFLETRSEVKDFVAEKAEIATSMMTFQAGAYLVEDSTKIDDGIVNVTVAIELKPLWNSVIFYKKKFALPID